MLLSLCEPRLDNGWGITTTNCIVVLYRPGYTTERREKKNYVIRMHAEWPLGFLFLRLAGENKVFVTETSKSEKSLTAALTSFNAAKRSWQMTINCKPYCIHTWEKRKMMLVECMQNNRWFLFLRLASINTSFFAETSKSEKTLTAAPTFFNAIRRWEKSFIELQNSSSNSVDGTASLRFKARILMQET